LLTIFPAVQRFRDKLHVGISTVQIRLSRSCVCN